MNLRNLALIGSVLAMFGCSESIDGLDDSTVDSIEKILSVKTSYGYGWSKKDSDGPSAIANFQLRLIYLWDYGGKRRGGVGRIVELGHEVDGKWIVFSTRHVGHYNFDTKLGQYNLSIGTQEPLKNDNGWPQFGENHLYSGWGEISANK